jgi:hypothetical protein
MPDDTDIHYRPRANVPPQAQTPLGLDYFAGGNPAPPASRAGNLAIALVIGSILPFGCGIVNLLVAANSYSPVATGTHRRGAILFLGAGVLVCLIGIIRLVTLRLGAAVLFAVLVLAIQLAILTCIGVAVVGR